MPQPLSRVKPDANVAYSMAGDRILSKHQPLAVLAIEARMVKQLMRPCGIGKA